MENQTSLETYKIYKVKKAKKSENKMILAGLAGGQELSIAHKHLNSSSVVLGASCRRLPLSQTVPTQFLMLSHRSINAYGNGSS